MVKAVGNVDAANEELDSAQHQQKKSKKKYIIIVAFIILIVVALLGLFFILSPGRG